MANSNDYMDKLLHKRMVRSPKDVGWDVPLKIGIRDNGKILINGRAYMNAGAMNRFVLQLIERAQDNIAKGKC